MLEGSWRVGWREVSKGGTGSRCIVYMYGINKILLKY